jgi:hypothetical protein
MGSFGILSYMKHFFLFILFFTSYLAQAQPPSKNLVRFSVDEVDVMGEADGLSPWRYSLRYGRQLGQSRWTIEPGLTYTSRSRTHQLAIPYPVAFTGDQTQLATLDVDFFYNLLRSNRHTLQLGAGPSLWYIRDSPISNLSYEISRDGTIQRISFERDTRNNIRPGVNLRAAYDYNVTPAVVVGFRTGISANLMSMPAFSTLGVSLFTLGLNLGYRF